MGTPRLSQDELAVISGVSVLGLLAWCNRERISVGLTRWLLEHDVLVVREELVVTITAGAGLDLPRLLIAVGGCAVLLFALVAGARSRFLRSKQLRETQ